MSTLSQHCTPIAVPASWNALRRRLPAPAGHSITITGAVTIGLFSSWCKHGRTYVPLPNDEQVLAIGLNRAVALVDAKRA